MIDWSKKNYISMFNSFQINSSFKIEKNSHFVHSGFSSRMKATKVWTPAQMEERARLISMKKNKNDLPQEVDIDLLDKINFTKVAAGPWSGWPLDKLQTPVRWIAGIISSSLSSSASSSLSSSSLSSPALYCHHCHCHHQHPTETISLIGLPLARLPRIAKTTTPAKTDVRELHRPTMNASL